MIREALVFHYLDDLDSKIAAIRVALATPSGDDEWSAYSGALGRKFLKLDEFLKASSQQPSAEGSEPRVTSPAERTSQAVVDVRNSAPADTQAQPATAEHATPPADSANAPQPKVAEGLLRKLFS